jgi:hypothetical protein
MRPRRYAPYLIAAAVAAGTLATAAERPATGAPERTAKYVVMVGAAGLRWEDVTQANTPTLWSLAERGSIGSLSVRSGHRPTCPVDGWITLGAGNYAARDRTTISGPCPATTVAIDRAQGGGANLPDQQELVTYNRSKLPWGAMPGALPESVRCTVAVGPGGAVAGARPFGRVDRYEARLPADPGKLLSECVLSIVDLGTVSSKDPVLRAGQAHTVDNSLARVLAARPEESLVMVAGISDTDTTSRLHVAIADGPGWENGWLTSASTGRTGYLQLVDLAPTALAALGKPDPPQLFAGHAARRIEGRTANLAAAVTRPADADREAGAQRGIVAWFSGILVAVQLLLFAAAVPLLHRARGQGGPTGPRPPPRRLIAAMEVLLVGGALAIPAALAADAVPWWRTGSPGLVFGATTLAILAAATTLVVVSPPFRTTLGPMQLAAAAAAVVVGVDVLTGARLQLNGVAGYSALEGGRYAGVGTVGLGVFTAGILLAAGCLAQRVPRHWRPPVLVVVGGLGVMIVGSPYLGADAGGAVALTAGVCIAVAVSVGGWLTFGRLAWATLAGVAVTAGFAMVDLRRPVEERGELGRFLHQIGEGSARLAVQRSGSANMSALVNSPLTILAVAAAIFGWFALLQPWGGLKRLYGLYPAIRAAVAGTAVATVMGGVLGGAALTVAGAAAATAVPLATLAALRVLGHATDKTQAVVVPPDVPVLAPASPASPRATPASPDTSPASPRATPASPRDDLAVVPPD